MTVKVGLNLPTKIYFIYFNENPLKLMKNAFYFILKTLVVVEIFNFVSRKKIGLIRKIRLNSKFTMSQTWLTNNYNTYCPISRELNATRK